MQTEQNAQKKESPPGGSVGIGEDDRQSLPEADKYASELSEIYIQEKNYAKALPLLKKKMNEGDLYAIELLAILYENGMGVERDYITAYALTLLHIYQYRKIYKTDNGIENLFHRKRRLLNALDYDSEREAITLAARLSVKIFKTTEKDRFKELSN